MTEDGERGREDAAPKRTTPRRRRESAEQRETAPVRQPGSGSRPRARPAGRGPAAVEAIGDLDLHLFHEGSHREAWRKLGAHPLGPEREAVRFAVWAPNARRVSVMGSFNDWDKDAHELAPLGGSGLWQGTVEGVGHGEAYKYHVVSKHGDYAVDKRDPFAFYGEAPPRSASRVWDLAYDWRDGGWMRRRARRNALDAPLSIYEVHLGSWGDLGVEGAPPLYRRLAQPLAEYVSEMGFTHVELMPLAEHPFYGSWGYQTTGYYSPTARYGEPQDLMHLIETLHRRDIGVILDWVPSHFPNDEHGLTYFDGTHLYEHADPRRGYHPEWKSSIFDYGRPEVRSFLISNALFWLSVYHVDALRVDAVASMLYRDYARSPGEWEPNEHGGRENLEAVEFLRRLNSAVHAAWPDVRTIAEESTSWPNVTRRPEDGGLGFDLKWDMGWMNDTLRYASRAPIHRRWHHRELTFRSLYATSECFVLPLSHDEVVYGKRSLLGKMPGDRWQRFANLRLLLAYTWAQTGKKLLFMGGEIAQEREWNHDRELDWPLLDELSHAGVRQLVADLNRLYRERPELHQLDCGAEGLQWVDADDEQRSTFTFLRLDRQGRPLLVCLNFTPVPRHGYRVGVPRKGRWDELLNTDDRAYGGSGQGNLGSATATPIGSHGRPFSLNLVVPPLGAVFLAPRR